MIGLATGILLPAAATGARVALGTVGMARDLARGMVRTFTPGQPDQAGISGAGRAMASLSDIARGKGCSVHEMQKEDFAWILEKLAGLMQENDLDFSDGIEIGLDENGNLLINHPDADALHSFLADDPELVGRMERAILSATLLDTADRMQRLRAQGASPYAQTAQMDSTLRPVTLQIEAGGIEILPPRS